MTVARSAPAAIYLDEKIYVMNVFIFGKSTNSLEVFDIKTQTWRALPSPGPDPELHECFIVNPDVFKRKFYVASQRKDYTYEPKDGTWNVVRQESSRFEILVSCVIDNVMYTCCCTGSFKWYDSESREWRDVKGLEGLCIEWGFTRMVNYGGKIVIMWRSCPEQDSENPKAQIWCARIALEKRHKDKIWGKTDWLNIVLEVPKSYDRYTCVAVLI